MIDEVYRRIDKFWQFFKQIAGKQKCVDDYKVINDVKNTQYTYKCRKNFTGFIFRFASNEKIIHEDIKKKKMCWKFIYRIMS